MVRMRTYIYINRCYLLIQGALVEIETIAITGEVQTM